MQGDLVVLYGFALSEILILLGIYLVIYHTLKTVFSPRVFRLWKSTFTDTLSSWQFWALLTVLTVVIPRFFMTPYLLFLTNLELVENFLTGSDILSSFFD